MGKTLDALIESHIASFVERYKSENECADEMFQKAKDALIDDFRKEVKEEIQSELTGAEIEEQKAVIDRAVDAHSAQKALQEIKGFIIEGIVLAIVIGLIVNQLTDIITYLKGTEAYWATLFIIIALVVIVLFYIVLRFANTVGKVLKYKGD